ncbi:hypothetical protein F8M41_018687 [Gigaspora margarita]|uniref:Transmembrane protein n=1 Tax=Gigaspora margarita TaxID=4874 RepID=A0A8H4B2G7_GIGMA|nr:hypothetical protein F8M41_018687 [Gigaspora margarita]
MFEHDKDVTKDGKVITKTLEREINATISNGNFITIGNDQREKISGILSCCFCWCTFVSLNILFLILPASLDDLSNQQFNGSFDLTTMPMFGPIVGMFCGAVVVSLIVACWAANF